ncbi:MAG: hypothetical protein V1761_05340 [bacterium]
MIKKIRRIVTRLLAVIVIILVVLLTTLNLTWNFFLRPATAADYSDWMRETLAGDRRVIDIAMLGAHDAMTSAIRFGSDVDPLSAASIQTGFTGALIKGFSIKQSKTQMSTTAVLLDRGVRYFDVRLTYHEEDAAWYVSHSYFSRPFVEDLEEIETFLADHPGEFVLIDIQHVYGVDYAASIEEFNAIKALFTDAGILARAVRDDSGMDLADLTYDDVTLNQTRGGVMIFSKFAMDDPFFWDYGTSIRSAWPNTDDAAAAFAFLADEATAIQAGTALTGNQIADFSSGIDSRQGLRIMQGVLTMQMTGSGILSAIGAWSLLTKARIFNAALIAAAEFPFWLSAMPIVMVDYADTNYKSFNDDIMAIIVAFNQSTEI